MLDILEKVVVASGVLSTFGNGIFALYRYRRDAVRQEKREDKELSLSQAEIEQNKDLTLSQAEKQLREELRQDARTLREAVKSLELDMRELYKALTAEQEEHAKLKIKFTTLEGQMQQINEHATFLETEILKYEKEKVEEQMRMSVKKEEIKQKETEIRRLQQIITDKERGGDGYGNRA